MKATVMVVDDSDEIRVLVNTILQLGGYEPMLKASA